jgi:hypothetical protein
VRLRERRQRERARARKLSREWVGELNLDFARDSYGVCSSPFSRRTKVLLLCGVCERGWLVGWLAGSLLDDG